MIDFLISRGLDAFDSFFKETKSSSYLDRVKQIFHFNHSDCDCLFKHTAAELFAKQIVVLSNDSQISLKLLALKEIIFLSGRFTLPEDEKSVVLYNVSKLPEDELSALNSELELEIEDSRQVFIDILRKQIEEPSESLENRLTKVLHQRLLSISLIYRLIQLNIDNVEKKPTHIIDVLDLISENYEKTEDQLLISYKVSQFYINYMKIKSRSPEIERRILSIIGG